MKIKIDKATKIVLLNAIKTGVLNTLDIPELYGKQVSYFEDLLAESNVGIPIEKWVTDLIDERGKSEK